MKILRVINELRQGGVQLRLVIVARELAKRGHDVTVLCIEAEGPNAEELRRAGVRVECRPVARWWSVREAWKLSRWMKAERFDVVHSHNFRQNMLATMAARFAGVPAIFAQVHTMHTYGRKQWVRTDQLLSRVRSAMLAVSEAVAQDIRQSLKPFPPPRLEVLLNGVELDAFRSMPREEARSGLLAEFRWPAKAVVFLNAGRLSEQKNQRELLEAFAAVHREHPQARLLIAGEGELRGELEQRVGELAIADAVALPGQREDMPRLLAGSDVFVLPSTYEGFSNAILEALASGLPVVASDVGGAREQIREGETGLVVPPRDVPALTHALQRLAGDSAERTRMAEGARKDAERFSLDAMIDRTLRLYREALAGKGRAGVGSD
jgi:glycosyltransferase involved in cell wall biosynthesis